MHDDIEIPEYIERLVGAPIESPEWDSRVSATMRDAEYVLTEVAAYSEKAVVFKAEPSEGDGPPIGMKLFHSEMDDEEDLPGIVDKIIQFQSGMRDPNIIDFYGSGSVEGVKGLLYEFMPLSLEYVIKQNPEGMSIDKVIELLPPLLNGLGYAHTHRGSDGVIRRLAHYSLKSANILLDRDTGVAKLDDCGFIKALLEVRGSKGYLWQEPGVGLEGLAPETFVLEGKFLNGPLVDIYALGVVLYEMVTGIKPFSGPGFDEFRFQHMKRFPAPPKVHNHTIPEWLDAMVVKCLEKEPEKRWRSPTQMELAVGKSYGF
jgi:serine/threonine-protein kinase